jgi:hypothetical protein
MDGPRVAPEFSGGIPLDQAVVILVLVQGEVADPVWRRMTS